MAAATSKPPPVGPPSREAWSRPFTASKQPGTFQAFSPARSEIFPMLALAHRIASYVGEERAAKRQPIFDLELPSMKPPPRRADQGMPLGGIGCGSIGRSSLGDFNRVDLQPGRCREGVVAANQFSVRVKRLSNSRSKAKSRAQKGLPETEAKVLSMLSGSRGKKPNIDGKRTGSIPPGPPFGGTFGGDLLKWNWGALDAAKCTYHALFPLSWYTYDEPISGLRLVCRQVNPVTPHEYSDSSMPVTVFRWSVENTSEDQDIEVSLMFTFGSGDSCTRTGDDASLQGDQKLEAGRFFGTPFYDRDTIAGATLMGAEAIPRTELRPESLDSPSRCRPCTFREFALLILLFLVSLMLGPFFVVQYNLSWLLWITASLVILAISQVVFYFPCKLHVRWFRQHRWNLCLRCFGGLDDERYHNVAVAYTISADVNEADVKTTVCTGFPTKGKIRDGERGMWERFVETGEASNGDYSSDSTHENRGNGVAVAQTVRLGPGESRELRFSLSWASPIVHFGEDMVLYRRYHRFAQAKTLKTNLSQNVKDQVHYAAELSSSFARVALLQGRWKVWEERISAWHLPILSDRSLPLWYKSQLFNELYFLQAGGAIWCDTQIMDGRSQQLSDEDDVCKNISHWLYLEGQEYYMYNTADVHFYASAALAMNWPRIERSIQVDYAHAVLSEDKQLRGLLGEPRWSVIAMRKPYGTVPHDLGSPSGMPWKKTNAYNFQDVSRWKDLGTKFVLQVLRDYIARDSTMGSADKNADAKEEASAVAFVRLCWPAVIAVMEKMKDFDRNGDGMIENEGFPDQTYDIWSAKGISAYSGGLWLAALQAAAQLARIVGGDEGKHFSKVWGDTFERASSVYENALWTEDEGGYYRYDDSGSAWHDSIMSDQLAGQWFSRACGLGGIVKSERAQRALRTVFERNVVGFAQLSKKKMGGGVQNNLANDEITFGAVNGTRPRTGDIDKSSMQSQEVWTGTTYAVAACMLQENAFAHASEKATSGMDLLSLGFRTAAGIHHAGWGLLGYHFQTPEAWNSAGNYRSLGYMRALGVWNMQWALENQ